MSAVATSTCDSCHSSVPQNAQFCPRCGTVQPQPARPSEKVIYRSADLLITSERIEFGTTSIVTSSIAAVDLEERTNKSSNGVGRLVLGLVIIGAAIGYDRQLWPLALIFGGALVLHGLGLLLTFRRWFEVIIRTSGGPEVLRVPTATAAAKIGHAIDEARHGARGCRDRRDFGTVQ